MIRKAMKDLTLHDGTVIPQGAIIQTAAYTIHHSEVSYSRPYDFDALRFWRMSEASEEGGANYRFSATSPEYLVFGYGQHAWFVA